MTTALTARSVFEQHKRALELDWAAGQNNADAFVETEHLNTRINSLVGHLDLIRPNLVQVLGPDELDYLDNLGKNSRQDAIEKLFQNQPLLIIFTDQLPPPDTFIKLAEKSGIPLLKTSLAASQIIDHLHHSLSSQLSEKLIQHGVFMEVMGLGILLTGPSGVGKSELALELLSRGHRLIADDAPEFRRTAPDTIYGSCPPMLADFLEVRGLGILNVRAMYGNNAVATGKRLHLIIQLQPAEDAGEQRVIDRLDVTQRHRGILEVEIPEVILPVAPGRDLSVIIEAAVRNHVLFLNGYNAAEDFIERQQHYIKKNSS